MEAMTGGVGNGLIQYGINDCRLEDVVIWTDTLARVNFPVGVTYADILSLRIHQYSDYYAGPGNDQWYYKQTNTTYSSTNTTTASSISSSQTYFDLHMKLLDRNGKVSVTEVSIIAKK